MADIVKIQLNTGKVIEAQESAFDIAGDINNWNVIVKIWDWDYIPANTILRIQTFKETFTLWAEKTIKNEEKVEENE